MTQLPGLAAGGGEQGLNQPSRIYALAGQYPKEKLDEQGRDRICKWLLDLKNSQPTKTETNPKTNNDNNKDRMLAIDFHTWNFQNLTSTSNLIYT